MKKYLKYVIVLFACCSVIGFLGYIINKEYKEYIFLKEKVEYYSKNINQYKNETNCEMIKVRLSQLIKHHNLAANELRKTKLYSNEGFLSKQIVKITNSKIKDEYLLPIKHKCID